MVKLSWFLGFYPGNGYTEGTFFDIVRGEFVPQSPGHGMMMDRDESRLLGRLLEVRVNELGTLALNRTLRVSFLNALLTFIGYHADTIRTVKSIEILKEVF